MTDARVRGGLKCARGCGVCVCRSEGEGVDGWNFSEEEVMGVGVSGRVGRVGRARKTSLEAGRRRGLGWAWGGEREAWLGFWPGGRFWRGRERATGLDGRTGRRVWPCGAGKRRLMDDVDG